MTSRLRPFLIGLLLFIAGALTASVVAWAVVAVTRPAEDPLKATDYTLVEVSAGEVGSSIQLSALAQWDTEPMGVNREAGVVTGVEVDPGEGVAQGTVLYTVDLRPVVIGRGAVPAFRDLSEGASGQDVGQLQQLLADLGFYRGAVDGKARSATASAIKAWQKSLGMEQTGVVLAGDVIFVPSLPMRVTLDSELVFRGATLGGGETVLSGLPTEPNFTIPVSDAQAAMMKTGTRVEILSPEGEVWTAFTGEQSRDTESGTVTVQLSGRDGQAICGDQCAQVPLSGQATLSSTIVTVETVAGLVVPSSALVSGADSQVSVIDGTGSRIPVTVTAAAQGMSVVEGVEEGTKVRVPGGADS